MPDQADNFVDGVENVHKAFRFPASGEQAFRDRRWTGSPVGVIRRLSQVGSPGAPNAFWYVNPAVHNFDILLDIVLGPGQGVHINNGTVNDQLDVNWWWQESLVP